MNFFVFLMGLALVSPAWALLPEPGKRGIGSAVSGPNDYRLGDEWGKQEVTQAMLAAATPAFRRAALATARTGGGTGFYLGQFAGQHVVATNHHVYPRASACLGTTIWFPLLGASGRCEAFLGSWSEVDLALFTLSVSAADAARLTPVAGSFAFADDLSAGQRLLTIGFGSAGNPGGRVMANQDSDCYVFSESGEYRLMADPDRWNPGSYRAWSFALGCDVSHGDSGSAIVDRDSGRVVGIIWTGRIPKSRAAQSSASLRRMFDAKSEARWEELSYAVPARKIGEFLERVAEGSVPEQTRAILREMGKR